MTTAPTIDDDAMLAEFCVTAELADGTCRPVDVPITVGMVRAYFAEPDACQCEDCLRVFPLADAVLKALEDHRAGRLTERQFERRLKRLGLKRGERVNYQ